LVRYGGLYHTLRGTSGSGSSGGGGRGISGIGLSRQIFLVEIVQHHHGTKNYAADNPRTRFGGGFRHVKKSLPDL
jgi:hypothetical protein